MKKIYFAGSIRGGRDDAALYARMIARINETCRVLTEHIGAKTIEDMGEQHMTDVDIYNQDIAWLTESDAVIAECSSPSLGVGYEMAYAEKLGKPVYILYNTTRGTLSAMLTGDPYYNISYYSSETELFSRIDDIIREIQEG